MTPRQIMDVLSNLILSAVVLQVAGAGDFVSRFITAQDWDYHASRFTD